MLSRLMNLLKGMMNKGMSQLETPEVLAEQAQMEIEDNIKKLKEAVIASLTTEKSLEQQLKKSSDELASWEKRARTAVEQNNDDVARQCLEKKQELNQMIATLTPQLANQKQASTDLKAKIKEAEEQLRQFHQKKANLVNRGQASDAVAKANQLLSDTAGGGTAKWEQKIQEKEFRAGAMQQMNSEPTGDKFAKLDQQMAVDDELAALKAQASPPKLIAGGPDHDNLPMVVDVEVEDDKDKK